LARSRIGPRLGDVALVGDRSCIDVFGCVPIRERGLRGLPKVLRGYCREAASRTNPRSSAVALVGDRSCVDVLGVFQSKRKV
jgi:hypothetical protein